MTDAAGGGRPLCLRSAASSQLAPHPPLEVRQRSEWLSRMRLSTNLRAPLNEAQARPELGGLVLAQRIGSFCSEVEARLDARCSSLVGDKNNVGAFTPRRA